MEQKSTVTGVWATVPHLVYIRASGQPPEPFAQFADQVRADPKWQDMRETDTRSALERGVFGAPTYVIGNDIFWGQDRLAFVEGRLARG